MSKYPKEEAFAKHLLQIKLHQKGINGKSHRFLSNGGNKSPL